MTSSTISAVRGTPAPRDSSESEVTAAVAAAAAAADVWAAAPMADRRAALDAIAAALDSHRDDLIPIAARETRLGEIRLRGELQRTSFQLRLFGEELAGGSFLDARIDHGDPDWPMGAPRPDLRRILQPLGPVVVFAAGNFPFAFSVAGGDTASALAAGCPVIVKAHPGHPELSAVVGGLVGQALAGVGAPVGLFAVIFGVAAGRQALTDPRVKAGSFTGSIAAGRALFDLAAARAEPIPFFGEMGSVNPVFVTRSAARLRPQQIARGFIDSFNASAGQLCTKPGVLFVPETSDVSGELTAAALPAAAALLDDRIQHGYLAALERLVQHAGVEVLAEGVGTFADPPTPTILMTTIDVLAKDREALLVECFGPTVLLVTYREEKDLLAAAGFLDGQLTAAIHGEPDDQIVPELLQLLAKKAGRLLWNQWPTGVSVTFAQQHGGPYPATTAPGTTSVGTGAIARFLRPVAYQGFPISLLPVALDDANALGIPRLVDGKATVGSG